MARPHISPNQREILYVTDSVTGNATYVTATNNKLDVNATASLAGSALPISGATTAVGVAIVDGSGNQITSFGGGTQYAELATTAPGTGTLSLGRYKSSAPTLTDGQLYGLQLDSSGNLKVIGTVNQGTSPWVTSNATTSVVGNGAAATAQRVTLANDSTGVISLTTSTASIGKLAANSGVIIGDVNVVSNIPGTGATNLGKAEDAGHTTGDTGVMSLGVRNDTLADVTSASADYSQLSTDLKGRVMVAGSPRALKGTFQVSLSNTTTETTILAATASTFHDIYGLILANTGATTTKVSIRDDTAGTVRAIIEVPTLETRGFMLPVDSAVPQTAVNKNWTAQCASATTALEVTGFYVSMV